MKTSRVENSSSGCRTMSLIGNKKQLARNQSELLASANKTPTANTPAMNSYSTSLRTVRRDQTVVVATRCGGAVVVHRQLAASYLYY